MDLRVVKPFEIAKQLCSLEICTRPVGFCLGGPLEKAEREGGVALRGGFLAQLQRIVRFSVDSFRLHDTLCPLGVSCDGPSRAYTGAKLHHAGQISLGPKGICDG